MELGSGSSEKTRLLLDALRAGGTLRCYAPVDVSERPWSRRRTRWPRSTRAWTCAPWCRTSRSTWGSRGEGDSALPPRLVAFLGSTIGNLLPDQRAAFLRPGPGRAAPGRLLPARHRPGQGPGHAGRRVRRRLAGVTAEFNKNVLAVLNAELGADFDLDEFEHVAVWDAAAEWIEMRLRSLADQAVHLPAIGLTAAFAAGEEMRTEVSAKFRRRRGGGRAGRGRPGHPVMVDGLRGTVRPVAVRSRLRGPGRRATSQPAQSSRRWADGGGLCWLAR